ncbi:MAG TPA: ABC transporter permease [Acetobacterium sp.]|nr:ABC transporter permease [Acetobacterium sp.]
MNTIFMLSLKSALREPFLLFWSIAVPIAGTLILGYLVHQPDYAIRITTAMMAMGILFYGLTTTVFSLLAQRRRGVFQLLKVTPLPLSAFIVSTSGAGTLVSLICGLWVLTVGSLAFQIGLSPEALLMTGLVCLVAGMGYVLLSFFVSRLCRTEAQTSITANLISMSLLLLSDAFYSLDAAPAIVIQLSRFNPFQWFLNGLRGALLRDYLQWRFSLFVLAGFLGLALLLAIWSLKANDQR